MSLIQEALRRQQEDDGGEAPPETTPPPAMTSSDEPPPMPAPSMPPPVPPAPTEIAPPPLPGLGDVPPELPGEEDGAGPDLSQAPAPIKASKPWKSLVGIILLVVVLVGCLGYGVMFAFKQWSGTKPAAVVPDDTDSDDPASDTDSDDNSATDDEPPTDLIKPVTDTDDVVSDATTDDTPEDEPEDEPDDPPEQILWPSVTLSGIVGRGASGSAMLNNEIVGVNESLEGVRLLSIGSQGVTLEYKGESRFLKVGNTTQ